MPTEVKLVQAGMAMQVGTIVQWFKDPGDSVEQGEVLGEAEADKTTVDIVAPASGVLAKIVVPEGDEVPVRTVLALITAPGEELNEDEEEPAAQHASTTTPAPPPPEEYGSPVQVTPAARLAARELGIDLAAVRGTGPGGRITEEDVKDSVELLGFQPQTGDRPDEIIPLRGTRGRIAERMLHSLHSTAQFTLTTEADVTELVRLHDDAKAQVPLTYTHLLIRACVLALRDHPRLNAVIDGGEIRIRSDIHIGIAVATDDSLIVPVLRDAGFMGLSEIVKSSGEIVSQARAGRGGVDLLAGGTFTVSNLGANGVDAFTPILNPPEVGILGAGRIAERPVRIGDGIAWRRVMVLSLTADHRAVDGVPAARFLQSVVQRLQEPGSLFD